MTEQTMAQPVLAAEPREQVRKEVREERPIALRVSDALRQTVDFVGRWGSWLVIPLVVITGIDVIGRKLVWRTSDGDVAGVQIWLTQHVSKLFESTLMQEMEWHFHTALFALVLGYGYIYNTHVRVDLIREKMPFRKKAWMELLGVALFMIPFTLTVIWFALDYAFSSYQLGEVSASTVGLTHRWIIKTILVFGLLMAALAGIAVLLQIVLVLWGDPNRRFRLMTLEWPEETGTTLEGKERIKLDDAVDVLKPPPIIAGREAG